MALRSLMQLRGLLEGLPGGSKNIVPSDMQNLSPPSLEIQLVLANGDNTIPAIGSIPANANGCVIIFDLTSTTIKTLKGAALDTGIILGKFGWNVITFDATPITNFIINSGGVDTGKTTTIIFF